MTNRQISGPSEAVAVVRIEDRRPRELENSGQSTKMAIGVVLREDRTRYGGVFIVAGTWTMLFKKRCHTNWIGMLGGQFLAISHPEVRIGTDFRA